MKIQIGSSMALAGTTYADRPELGGTVLEDVLAEFAAADVGVSGTVQLSVQSSQLAPTQQISFRVKELRGGELDRAIWELPGRLVEIDVDYRLDGLGEVGPEAIVLAESSTLPARTLLDFQFSAPITETATGRFVFVITESQLSERSGTIRLEGTTTSGARWASEVPAFAPVAVPAPRSPALGEVSTPLVLSFLGETLCAVNPSLVAAVGHVQPAQRDDSIDQSEVMIALIDTSGPEPTISSQITVADSKHRRIQGVVSDRGYAYLVMQQFIGTAWTKAELFTIDCRQPDRPIITRRTTVEHIPRPMVSVALAGDRVWISGDSDQPLVAFDVTSPGAPRQLPPTKQIAGLLQNVGWIAGGDDVVHLHGSDGRADSKPLIVTISATGDTQTPQVLSNSRLPATASRVFAGADVAVAVYWNSPNPAVGTATILRRRSNSGYDVSGTIELEGEGRAVAVHDDPLRLVILSRWTPVLEVWELSGGTGRRLGDVEYPSYLQGDESAMSQVVIAGGKACFVGLERLHTVDISNLLLNVVLPDRLPERQPRPHRVPRR